MNFYVYPEKELLKLFEYVKKNVPYYKNIEASKLNDFPIINKMEINEHFDDFQSKKFKNTKLHWVATSGSTGNPFRASQNKNKRKRNIADLLFFHGLNGWKLGYKYVFLRAWTSNYKVSKLRIFAQNYYPIDLENFNDEKKDNLIKLLNNNKKIKVLITYASGLENFMNYIQEKQIKIISNNLKVIFTDSDDLKKSTKEKANKIFGCPIINRYSNEEQGVLACTSPDEDEFILNNASYYFELLQLDKDEPVKPGEVGRVVITDLYNYSMPFIRYDTGDLAVSHDLDRFNITTFDSLQGRMSDLIYSTKGFMVSSGIVNNHFFKLNKIKQYQIIQTEIKKYIINIVYKNLVREDNYVIDVCKEILGEDADIKLVKLEKISSEKNGKFKTVINRMENK